MLCLRNLVRFVVCVLPIAATAMVHVQGRVVPVLALEGIFRCCLLLYAVVMLLRCYAYDIVIKGYDQPGRKRRHNTWYVLCPIQYFVPVAVGSY